MRRQVIEHLISFLSVLMVPVCYGFISPYPQFVTAQIFVVVFVATWMQCLWVALAISSLLLGAHWPEEVRQGYLLLTCLIMSGYALRTRLSTRAHAQNWVARLVPLRGQTIRVTAFLAGLLLTASMMLKAMPLPETFAWSVALITLSLSIRPHTGLTKSTRWRTRLATGLLLLFSVGFSFGMVEVGCRILVKSVVPQVDSYIPHPDYIFTLAADVSGPYTVDATEGGPFEFMWTASSQGIHAQVEYGKKADDEFRILFLGDSFTAGHGLDYDDTMSQALQSLLAEHSLEKRCVVINAGVGGYGPWQERGFLHERGFAFEPDLVVHQLFTANDVHDTLLQYDIQTEAYPEWWHQRMDSYRNRSLLRYRVHEWLLRRVRSYQVLSRYLPGATLPWFPNRLRYFALEKKKYPKSSPRNWSMEMNLETWYDTLDEGWKLFEQDVLGIKKDCEDRGIDYISFCLPLYVSNRDELWNSFFKFLEPGQNYVKFKDVTETELFYEREGIAYVSVYKALARQPDQSQMFHHPDGHLKKAGSWIVAKEIRDYLLSEYFR